MVSICVAVVASSSSCALSVSLSLGDVRAVTDTVWLCGILSFTAEYTYTTLRRLRVFVRSIRSHNYADDDGGNSRGSPLGGQVCSTGLTRLLQSASHNN